MRRGKRRQTWAQSHDKWLASAQGEFESERRDYQALTRDPLRQVECREHLARAIAAGERRVAEVAGTESEAGWRAAVESLKAQQAAF